ncbi:serine protease grass-like isoform X2 [Drosophila ficusphila]|uniref:serine protease grass-like isoform X2 n=1 Tax=Drosophila ficusphila TaxID=30025 RepID=UPI0007E65CC0|nr:serine protease grass-like isoform X2 [Drosophila ficusphila]
MDLLFACLILGIHGSLAYSLLDPSCVEYPRVSPLIYGGEATDILNNPWMVQILKAGRHHCGGSLITPQFILSAAHCQSKSNLTARLGYSGNSKRKVCSDGKCSSASVEINLDRTFVHPNHFNYLYYDIAIYRLERPVQFNAQIKPICVIRTFYRESQTMILQNVGRFNVTGWGLTSEGENSRVLQITSLAHLDRQFCTTTFRMNIDEDHICAGDVNTGTCNGDSGGPLSARMEFEGKVRPFLFGTTSYGAPGCRTASVFTSVMAFSDWISNVVYLNTPREDRSTNYFGQRRTRMYPNS